MTPPEATPIAERELGLTRLIPVARQTLWRCWTEPELLMPWFCPKPWRVVRAQMDVRPGGQSLIVMQGPEGPEVPNPGLFLDVVPGQRLVFTDAFTRAWEPSNKAFMVATIEFADEAGGTRYTARVQHWSAADRQTHEAMGFHAGWGAATDQLAAFAATL